MWSGMMPGTVEQLNKCHLHAVMTIMIMWSAITAYFIVQCHAMPCTALEEDQSALSICHRMAT